MARRTHVAPRATSPKFKIILSLAVITVLTVIAFWGVKDLGFVNYDDDMFILNRPQMQQGLSATGLAWALISPAFPYQNWIPLTLLTYLVDNEIGGLNPLTYHVTNLILHLFAALLLFWVLYRMTGDIWPCFVAAAFFAVHPLRVESVAWISERKDVLAAVFWMLSMLAYVRYRERPGKGRYLALVVLFLLGLMSKPMLVTLPCVLFLMDVWPLKHLDARSLFSRDSWRRIRPYVLDKLPLLAVSIVVVAGTALLQTQAIQAMDGVPLGARVANAALSYIAYIGKTLWPAGLAAFYPHPGSSLPTLHVVGSLLLLTTVTGTVIALRSTYPYFIVGWLWYIVTLLPVIGLIQLGEQAMADRYTYLPVLGINIAVAWGLWQWLASHPKALRVATAVALIVLIALVSVTRHQTLFWRDSETLWQRAIAVTENNAKAHFNLGCVYANERRHTEASAHFAEAVRIKPTDSQAAVYLGSVQMEEGRFEDAARAFQAALDIEPDHLKALYLLGVAQFQQGAAAEAEACFGRVLELNPTYPEAHYNMGAALMVQGKREQAAQHFEAELKIDPNDAAAQQALEAIRSRHR